MRLDIVERVLEARSTGDAMNASESAIALAIDVIAAGSEPIDARLWRRLLIYVPHGLVLDRAKVIRNTAKELTR